MNTHIDHRKEWLPRLKELEDAYQWNEAILFLQEIIKQYPDEMWAYLFLMYIIIDVILEEHPELEKNYKTNFEECNLPLVKHYFDISYAKFYHNPDYLYFAARAVLLIPWRIRVPEELSEELFEKAEIMRPGHIIYQIKFYEELFKKNNSDKDAYIFALKNLSNDSPIKQYTHDKGCLGKDILSWYIPSCYRIVVAYQKIKNEEKRKKWQKEVDFLIEEKELESALIHIENIIHNDESDAWAYVYVIFILGKILESDAQSLYQEKIHHYFTLSYEKFSEQCEYSYFMGIACFLNQKYMNISLETIMCIIQKALDINQFEYSFYPSPHYLIDQKKNITSWDYIFAKDVLQKNCLKNEFFEAGALRQDIIKCIEHTSKIVVERYEKENNETITI